MACSSLVCQGRQITFLCWKKEKTPKKVARSLFLSLTRRKSHNCRWMQIKVGAALHMHAGFSLEMKLYPTTCTLTFLEEPHTSPIYDECQTQAAPQCNVWIFPLSSFTADAARKGSKIYSHISSNFCSDHQDGRWIIKALIAIQY